MIHRSLSAQAFLVYISEGRRFIVLNEFYCATNEQPVLNEVAGVPLYISPECYRQEYDSKVDCWAIGCIVFLMVTGKPLFDMHDLREIQEATLHINYTMVMQRLRNHSLYLQEFVRNMICPSAKRRLAQTMLFHPWI